MSKEMKAFEELERGYLHGTDGDFRKKLKEKYIEPIKQALERNVAKKPKINKYNSRHICDNCGRSIFKYANFCKYCGQKLDWGGEDE